MREDIGYLRNFGNHCLKQNKKSGPQILVGFVLFVISFPIIQRYLAVKEAGLLLFVVTMISLRRER